MKTLLVVFSHSTANDLIARHWPFYLNAECDILGVGREDTQCLWPTSYRLIGTVNIGKEGYAQGDDLPRRLVRTWEHCLRLPYDEFVIIEADCIILKPIPQLAPGLHGALVGHRSAGYHAADFYHPPWGSDRETTKLLVKYGHRLLNCGLYENGFPDRWLGLLRELYDIPFTPTDTYSQNRLDMPQYIADARKAIADGKWAIHGVKTEAELKAVTEELI